MFDSIESYDSNYFKEEIKVEDLFFENNLLNFKIVKYTTKPKITRYVQRNYERIPIYGDLSTKRKVLKNFNKKVVPERFFELEIHNIDDLYFKHKKMICEFCEQKPRWLQIELEIEKLISTNDSLSKNFRFFDKEKKKYSFKPANRNEKESNLWIRLILVPFTLGLSFIKYNSKTRAENNKKLNDEEKIWNEEHKIEIDKFNDNLKIEIDNHNRNVNFLIQINKNKIDELNLEKDKKFNFVEENSWIDLRKSIIFPPENLKNTKGIYIIWNKTKEMFYVGQSKNIYNRLFSQHFSSKDNCPKNYIFFRDWDNGDEFLWRYERCDTKDELDGKEKYYIEYYDSFRNGYNKTGGNE